MTRIPVKFRDSLNISSPTKDFIKKCLEVDERKRMSLEDLRVWLDNSPTKGNKNQENPLQMIRKPFSNIENITINPQNDNKLSSRDSKSRSFTSNQRPNIMNK